MLCCLHISACHPYTFISRTHKWLTRTINSEVAYEVSVYIMLKTFLWAESAVPSIRLCTFNIVDTTKRPYESWKKLQSDEFFCHVNKKTSKPHILLWFITDDAKIRYWNLNVTYPTPMHLGVRSSNVGWLIWGCGGLHIGREHNPYWHDSRCSSIYRHAHTDTHTHEMEKDSSHP